MRGRCTCYCQLSPFSYLFPIWLKVIALLVYTGVCRYILTLIFDKVMDAPFLIGTDKESDEYYRARKAVSTSCTMRLPPVVF